MVDWMVENNLSYLVTSMKESNIILILYFGRRVLVFRALVVRLVYKE